VGTTYTWTVSTNSNITGQSNQTTPQSILGQTLINNTDVPQQIIYNVTPIYLNCLGSVFTLTVTVNPTPKISNQSISSCSGITFSVTPAHNPPVNIIPSGTTYTWTFIPNSNLTGSVNQTAPASTISQTLNNISTNSQQLVYSVTPKTGSCSGLSFSLIAAIQPKPSRPLISINGSNEICDGDSVALISSSTSGNTWLYQNMPIVGANGQIYYAREIGGYSVITNSSSGCLSDTSASVNIIVNSIPTKPSITINGNVLTSSYSIGTQWYLNGQPIPGATGQNYIATIDGYYTVEVTINGCKSMPSETIFWNKAGQIDIAIKPNPASDQVEIIIKGVSTNGNYWVSVFDAHGKLMIQKFESSRLTIPVSKWPSGIYFIRVNSLDGKKSSSSCFLKSN
jgi:hypothetical protein